jgi:hypothetical protein
MNMQKARVQMPGLTRRTVLTGTALSALAAVAEPVMAAAPAVGRPAPGVYRYRVGSFEVTALYDGIWYRPITDTFIRNAPFAEVERALDRALMPHDKLDTPFTTLCSPSSPLRQIEGLHERMISGSS